MFGLDDWISQLGSGEGLAVALALALLLGLRHALDPDHLAAVSTLIASEGEAEDGTRRAGRLGLAWGLGHAVTLAAFGVPIVLFGAYLPDIVQRAAEALIGVTIMFLALRLLVRWHRGRFHAHAHRHGGLEHRHLHPHHQAAHDHSHRPEARLGRSARQAFAIGLLHGMGGSAGVGILLLAGIPGRAEAIAALLVLALGTAVSMTAVSTAFGYMISRGPVVRRTLAFAPAMGFVALAFGGWYALGAVGAVPYPV